MSGPETTGPAVPPEIPGSVSPPPAPPVPAAPPAPALPLPEAWQLSASPHLRDADTVPGIMRWVIGALLPATVWGCWGYGLSAFFVVAVAVVAAVLAEALFQRMRGVPVTVHDGSAALTGLLLALTIPPNTPLYQVAIGSIFAAGAAKQAFGGLGFNIVNPALAGRAFLLACFPANIKLPVYPGWGIDGASGPTVLTSLHAGQSASVTLFDALLGREGGAIGEVSALLLLLGGLVLLAKRIIDWRIPVFFILATVVGLAVFPVRLSDGAYGPWLGALGSLDGIALHLLSGGLILGAFFMATDMVTSPITARARTVFACGCGLLTVFIRLYGGYPEGVCYSIILMNLTVPMLDNWFGTPGLGRRKGTHA